MFSQYHTGLNLFSVVPFLLHLFVHDLLRELTGKIMATHLYQVNSSTSTCRLISVSLNHLIRCQENISWLQWAHWLGYVPTDPVTLAYRDQTSACDFPFQRPWEWHHRPEGQVELSGELNFLHKQHPPYYSFCLYSPTPISDLLTHFYLFLKVYFKQYVKVKLLKAHALFPGHFFIHQRNIDPLILSCILFMFINTFCKPRTVLDELGYPDLKELSPGRKWMYQYTQSSNFQIAGDNLQFRCQTVSVILCNFE